MKIKATISLIIIAIAALTALIWAAVTAEDAETKALGYITDPIYVKKKSVKKSTNESGVNLRGQFTMTIEDRCISTDFTENLAIIYATKDNQGNRIEVSSDPFKVTSAPVSSLPKVYITTPDGAAITSKTEWLNDCSITIGGSK